MCFFKGIETSIHFLGMKQKTISQATSNDKRVKKKNKHFRIGNRETNNSCGLGDKDPVYITGGRCSNPPRNCSRNNKKKEIESSYSWKEKRKQYSFFQGIETSIPFLGKKQQIFKSIDFK